jgi:hypothetical protein
MFEMWPNNHTENTSPKGLYIVKLTTKKTMTSSYEQITMATLFQVASIKGIKPLHKWLYQKAAIFWLRRRVRLKLNNCYLLEENTPSGKA